MCQCQTDTYLDETAGTPLRNVTEHLTVVLNSYQQKYQAKKSKAIMKAIEEHHKLKETTQGDAGEYFKDRGR